MTSYPVRATYRGHGYPQRFYFFGTGEFYAQQSAPLITMVVNDRSDRTIRLHDYDGNEVARFGSATKFWLTTSPPSVEFWELFHANGDKLPDPEAVAAADCTGCQTTRIHGVAVVASAHQCSKKDGAAALAQIGTPIPAGMVRATCSCGEQFLAATLAEARLLINAHPCSKREGTR